MGDSIFWVWMQAVMWGALAFMVPMTALRWVIGSITGDRL